MYFENVVKDAIKDIMKRGNAYAFSMEQVEEISNRLKKKKIQIKCKDDCGIFILRKVK